MAQKHPYAVDFFVWYVLDEPQTLNRIPLKALADLFPS